MEENMTDKIKEFLKRRIDSILSGYDIKNYSAYFPGEPESFIGQIERIINGDPIPKKQLEVCLTQPNERDTVYSGHYLELYIDVYPSSQKTGICIMQITVVSHFDAFKSGDKIEGDNFTINCYPVSTRPCAEHIVEIIEIIKTSNDHISVDVKKQ